MNNDKALTIVEAAQSPQVVAVSDVSKDEIEYQRADKEYKAVFDQFRLAMKRRHTVRLRLTKAWLAENYPGLRCEVTAHIEERAYTMIDYNIEIIINSPMTDIILQELQAYFAQLSR